MMPEYTEEQDIRQNNNLLAMIAEEVTSADYRHLQERIQAGPHPPAEKLYDYATGSSDIDDTRIIQDHLELCAACAAEVLRIRLIEAEFDAFPTEDPAGVLFREDAANPLPVTAVYDRMTSDLIHDYYAKPLMDRLAAATGKDSELTFPITVEYADGQIIGEFWKRAGYLFYRLKKSAHDQQQYLYTLVYTSPADPEDLRTFELREGENKRLGTFREFVAADTKQTMLQTMRQFRMFLKQKK